MRKILLIIIIFLLLLLLIKFQKKENLKPITLNPVQNTQVIDEINKNNSKINKIKADLTIEISMIRSKGFIAYEKENKFELVCNSFLGKELEIGSNDNFFWFWSKSFDAKTLFYADLDRLNDTRLRKIFYPNIIKSFIGIDEIKQAEVFKDNEKFHIIEKIKISNELFKKITIVENYKIISHQLLDSNGKLILQADVIEFQKSSNLPKIIKVNWIEENINQKWIISKPIFDFEKEWQMPDYKNKINLINY